jgi:hypothetical protein
MAKQSKKPADLNRLAAAIVGDATDESAPEEPQTSEDDGKTPRLSPGSQGRRKRWQDKGGQDDARAAKRRGEESRQGTVDELTPSLS